VIFILILFCDCELDCVLFFELEGFELIVVTMLDVFDLELVEAQILALLELFVPPLLVLPAIFAL
jgi:hypothetical protein